MLRFYLKSFFLIAAVIGTIFAFNYIIYTNHIHKGYDFHERISQILLQGKTAAGMYAFDSALAKRLYIEKAGKRKLDVLILGTSKVMLVGGDMLKGKKYYNAAILLASIKEYETMFYICEKNGFSADNILIEIDHRLFSKKHEKWNYLTIYDKYWEFLKWIYPDRDNTKSLSDRFKYFISKYENYFSISYMHQTIATIMAKQKTYDENIFSAQLDNPATYGFGWLISPDGRMHFPGGFRFSSQKDLNTSVEHWVASNDKDFYYKDQEISDELVNNFVDFVLFLKRIGKKVYFFVPPYNPILYNTIKDDPKYDIFLRVEKLIRKIGKENNIKVYGSFEPKGFTKDQYYDHWHSREEVMKTIFKNIDFDE